MWTFIKTLEILDPTDTHYEERIQHLCNNLHRYFINRFMARKGQAEYYGMQQAILSGDFLYIKKYCHRYTKHNKGPNSWTVFPIDPPFKGFHVPTARKLRARKPNQRRRGIG
ncbi:hypothetical protein NVP2275O_167 [Vibrio phage 2.275.O._10N.286.54.E11]|nr:hypothetical protein NVP2275O_167 [Vibrio phage 2.275.O._10N.286.54.E11]